MRIKLSPFCIGDESLFSPIFLPLCTLLDGCLVLNYIYLVHFLVLGFIGPIIQIFTNLDLLGLIFVCQLFSGLL